jgi:hypothetical protein
MGNAYGWGNGKIDFRPVHFVDNDDEDINAACGKGGSDPNYSSLVSEVTCLKCKRTKQFQYKLKEGSCPWCRSQIVECQKIDDTGKYAIVCLCCESRGPKSDTYDEAWIRFSTW